MSIFCSHTLIDVYEIAKYKLGSAGAEIIATISFNLLNLEGHCFIVINHTDLKSILIDIYAEVYLKFNLEYFRIIFTFLIFTQGVE